MEEELSKLIYKLAEKVVRLIEEGKIGTEEVPYIRTKIEDFDYKNGGIGFSAHYEDIIKEVWNPKEKHEFIEKEIKKLDNYGKAIELVAKRTGESKPQSELYLDRFFQKVINEALSGLDDEDLVSLSCLFTSEIEGAPVLWNPEIWVTGINMKTKRLKINEDLEIKRPEPSDLEEEIRLELPPRWVRSFPQSPSAIIFYRTRAKGQPLVHKKIEEIFSLLRLYKLGSAQRTKTDWNTRSILQMKGTSSSNRAKATPFKYSLSQEDKGKIRAFIEVIQPLFSKEISSRENENFLTIAHQRYEDALTAQSSSEGRLLSAIMSLEALYLKEKEREELSERLAHRTATALSFLDIDSPIKVRNRIKSGYGMRSDYVHGSKIDEEERGGIQNLARDISEYARASILLYLQLRGELEKKKLISKLDNSLLSEKSRKRLEETIQENVEIFPSIS